MDSSSLFLGIDLGTSGVQIALINADAELIHQSKEEYCNGVQFPEDWQSCCSSLIGDIPKKLKQKIKALSVDGTSGTLLACDKKGRPISLALPYNISCPEQKQFLAELIPEGGIASSINSSLARTLRLIDQHGPNILIRHQADWLCGWFLNNWQWGEEGNNIRLGWNLIKQSWPQRFANLPWKESLPSIINSGNILGKLDVKICKVLELPEELIVISGTTDSNAAVLAANPKPEDGITVLGSTIVLKCFVEQPLTGIGITNHRVGGKWLCGGASNAGGAVIRKFFSPKEIKELSRQINPELNSGLMLRPLPFKGERFPIEDPYLEPILEPRPISDSLYLHGLFEGLARIEAQGWEALQAIGVPKPRRVITLGGAARNPQFRRLRERTLRIPIHSCSNPPALGVALLARQSITNKILFSY